MKYKVTKHYARDEEKPFAEFIDVTDAELFIKNRSFQDNESHTQIIYRVFDGYQLLTEFNKDKINTTVTRAHYADGDRPFPDSLGLTFKVEATNLPLAEFLDLNDADLYMEAKLMTDAAANVNVTYRILDKTGCLKEKSQPEGSQGNAQTASFRPTPLNMTPHPPGTPPAWLKDDEKDIEK